MFKKITLLISVLLTTTADAKYLKQNVYTRNGAEGLIQIWKELNIYSKQITVAVIDTGINTTHPDLKSQLWINDAELNGEVGIDDDGNGYIDDINGYNFVSNNANIEDTQGHGTHVSGIIAAAHNGKGVRGVNPLARIMTLKAFSSKTSDIKYAIEAIYYAVNNGVKIINCSWEETKKSPELEEAIDYAVAKGAIIIAGAGNTQMEKRRDVTRLHHYLTNFDNVISIANHLPNGKMLSDNSRYGSTKVDIAAPGHFINSTYLNHGYKNLSGTSMASPYVAGAISLLFSMGEELELEQVRERLYRTGVYRRRFKRKLKSQKMFNIFNFIKDIAP